MKKPIFLVFALPFFLSFHSSILNDVNSANEFLLQEAIQMKKVNSKILSNGGHDLNSVRIMLTNTTSSPLKITIPNGTIFVPENAYEQELLLVEDEMLVLQPNQQKEYSVDAYCTESGDSSPDKEGKMTMTMVKSDSQLTKLCKSIKDKKIGNDDIQSAVWAITDNEPIERISMNTPAAVQLRETVSQMTGQQNSWYSVGVNRRLDENRRIQTSSASISGKLKINLSAPSKVHEEVVDEAGNVKFTMKAADFNKAGEWNYGFNIRVMGWKKGDYKVLVFQDGKKINEFPFAV